ncbi:type IV secretion system DNA-binding domain-containing protein [Xanthomonas axonopodis]
MMPTIFQVLKLFGKVPGLKGFVDIEAKIRDKADEEIYEVVGAFDDYVKIPSNTLYNVSIEDESLVEALGATKQANGNWHVSDELKFSRELEPWMPDATEDMIVRFENSKITRSGYAMDSVVLSEDMTNGSVSSAIPLMFAALPVIACATFILTHIIGSYGYAALFAAIPYLKAIKLDKSGSHAIGAFFFMLLGPLLVAKHSLSAVGQLASGLLTGGPGLTALGIGFVVLVVITFLLCFLGSKAGSRHMKTIDQFVRALKVEAMFAIYVAAVSLLPASMNLIFIFSIPTLYCIRFTQAERETRASETASNSNHFTMGRHERILRDMLKKQWITQALRAFLDKSPVIALGTSTGFLFNKMYRFAVTAGRRLLASFKDVSQHILIIGKSGGGKTYMLRKFMADVKLTGKAGALVGDGKNVLVREVEVLMDIVIKEGVNLSLSQGLNAQQLTLAMKEARSKGKESEGKDEFWKSMGNIVLDHTAMIVEALCESEKYIRKNTAAMLLDEENRILKLTALSRISELENNSADMEKMVQEIVEAESNICKLQECLDRPRSCFWTIGAIQKFLLVINQVTETKEGYQMHPNFQGAFAFITGSGYLQVADAANQIEGSIAYFMNTWCAMAPETRTSITANIDQSITEIFRGRHLKNYDGVLWADIETGIDFDDVLTKKAWVGVDLPTNIHGAGGVITADIVRMRIYNLIKTRPENWAKLEGHNPVFNFIDEAQSVIGEAERDLIAMARSLGCYFVFLTQNISSFRAAFSEHGANNLFELFANKVLLQNESSPSTYKYFQELLGKARLTPYKTKSVGINNQAMLQRYGNSALVNPNHPDAVFMQSLREKGVGAMQNSYVHQAPRKIDVKDAAHQFDDIERIQNFDLETVQGTELAWVMDDDDFSNTLFQGQALCVVSRAGSIRAEICEVSGLEADEVEFYMAKHQANDPANKGLWIES